MSTASIVEARKLKRESTKAVTFGIQNGIKNLTLNTSESKQSTDKSQQMSFRSPRQTLNFEPGAQVTIASNGKTSFGLSTIDEECKSQTTDSFASVHSNHSSNNGSNSSFTIDSPSSHQRSQQAENWGNNNTNTNSNNNSNNSNNTKDNNYNAFNTKGTNNMAFKFDSRSSIVVTDPINNTVIKPNININTNNSNNNSNNSNDKFSRNNTHNNNNNCNTHNASNNIGFVVPISNETKTNEFECKQQDARNNDNNDNQFGVNMNGERATNDPLAPKGDEREYARMFPAVSACAMKYQFICDCYQRIKKQESITIDDFNKLHSIINSLYAKFIAKFQQNRALNQFCQNNNNNHNSNNNNNNPRIRCSLCRKNDILAQMIFTTCNHPLCIQCLANTFIKAPKMMIIGNRNTNNVKEKKVHWYLCPINGCNALLPPQTHMYVLTYQPTSNSGNNGNNNSRNNNNNNNNNNVNDKRIKEYNTKYRNIAFKNFLKIFGDLYKKDLQNYPRWKSCDNCEFGFLADPSVDWRKIFELKCVVCKSVQRCQLVCPKPIGNSLKLTNTYYPVDGMSKVLIFVRHAQAQNNACNGNRNNIPVDPYLTPKGIEQCAHLNRYFSSLIGNGIELILTSTMNRTLQTACLCFKSLINNNNNNNDNSNNNNMNNNNNNNTNNSNVKWIALECLRERMSIHFNRRTKINDKKSKFGHIDFSNCLSNDDIYFDKERQNESFESMNERAWQFYMYLIKRPEKKIVIVTHEGMLQCLFGVIPVSKQLKHRFQNAEARISWLIQRHKPQ